MSIKKNILLSALVSLFCIPTFAQPGYRVFDFIDPSLKAFSVSAQMGISSYYGDLCATNDCYTKTKINTGIGATLRLNDYFFFNFNALYYRIEGSDAESNNLGRMRRNLSFRSDNLEFSVLGNFEFLNYNTFRYLTRKEFPLSLFSFVGLGITTNSPTALYQGSYVDLRPLQTEAVSYSPVAAVIPIGLGIGYRFNEFFSSSFSVGYRYSFTDYLDDVSTTYVGDAQFSNQIAKDLQYRGDEVPFGRYYGEGSKRGNPDSNDGYMIASLRVEYKIPKVNLNFIGSKRFGGAGGGPKSGGAQPTRKAAKRRNSK
jgi:hypothetical protein